MYHSVIKRLAEPRVRPLLPLITIARSPLTKSVIGNTTLFSLASLGARDDGTFIVEFKIARAYFGNLAEYGDRRCSSIFRPNGIAGNCLSAPGVRRAAAKCRAQLQRFPHVGRSLRPYDQA
jgi:hypothetical protein